MVTARADERSALAAAIGDLARQGDTTARTTTRYVWIAPVGDVTAAEVDYALNAAAGTSSRIVRSRPIADDCLAVDLAILDPYTTAKLTQNWDALAIEDPVFHLIAELQEGETRAVLAPHLAEHVATEVTGKGDKRLDVIAAELAESTAPLLEARFLIEALLDRHYYRFRQVAVGDDLAEVLARSGYFFKTAKDTRGLRANLVLRSQITGDQRIVLALQGLSRSAVASITYDLADTTTKPEAQFTRNLATFNTSADGGELFIPMASGLLECLLFDGDFKLVGEAPATLAADHSKPAGHDRILRPALSCISCHSQGAAESFYKPVPNDFGKLPAGSGVEVFDTFATPIDTPDGPLGRARRDYAAAASQIAGSEPGAIEALHQRVTAIVHRYRYDLVDAAAELGLPSGESLADRITLTPGEPVDPEIALAIAGVPLARKSFDAVRASLAGLLTTTNTTEEATQP